MAVNLQLPRWDPHEGIPSLRLRTSCRLLRMPPLCSAANLHYYFSVAPGIELKGEYCTYYFLIQGKDNGVCKATMLHSASQINGAASLVLLHRRLRDKPNTEESSKNRLCFSLVNPWNNHLDSICALVTLSGHKVQAAVFKFKQITHNNTKNTNCLLIYFL